MPSRTNRSRQTEASLMVFALLILICGAFLVFFAKTRSGVPQNAINLNRVSAEEFALALKLDPEIAARFVKLRELKGGLIHVDQLADLPLFVGTEEIARARSSIETKAIDPNSDSEEALRARLEVPPAVARRIVQHRVARSGGQLNRPVEMLKTPLLDAAVIRSQGDRLIVRHPANVFIQLVFWGTISGLLVLFTLILLNRAGVGGDPYLLPFTILLTGMGVLVLFSIKDPLRDTPVYVHHIQGGCLGIGALLLGALMPSRTRQNLRQYTYLWAIVGIGLLVLLKLFGYGPENVRLSLFGIQPVEIVKILLILFTAGYLTMRADLGADSQMRWRASSHEKGCMHSAEATKQSGWLPMLRCARVTAPRWRELGPLLGVFSVALLLFLIVRDLGPALLLFGAFLATLCVWSGRGGLGLIGLGMMLAGGFFAWIFKIGVVPVRVAMWLSPWDNPHAFGMQLGQSYWGMASGGWSGSGLGLGAPALMPRSGSDLVFASLGEELGLVGTITVLIVFTLLIWRGLKSALRAEHEFDRALALGLTSLIVCQVFLILAGVTGLLPLTGITLPFVAYGNSSLIANFFLIGLLQGISASGNRITQAPDHFRRSSRNLALTSGFALLGCVGIVRLIPLQLVTADEVAGRPIRTPDADGNRRAKLNPRLLSIQQSITRGSIYDRNGKVLATSRLDEISREVDNPTLARELFRKGRYYPLGSDLAHLVGYADPSIGGPQGLELDHNRSLRGFESYSDLLPTYRSKDLPVIPWKKRGSQRGLNLTLTIDADMQHAAMGILKRRSAATIDHQTAKPHDRAAIVALDPHTGDVLVSASIPTFDPNSSNSKSWQAMQADTANSAPMLDRSRFGYYPPGSTMKVVTGSIGLDHGLNPSYNCDHARTNLRWRYAGAGYGRKSLTDDRGDPPHGPIKMSDAMRVSCNLWFANLATNIGTDRFHNSLYGGSGWKFSKASSKQSFAAALPYNGFGQGVILATPTEMARAVAAIAADGAMPQPRYWRTLSDDRGTVIVRNRISAAARPVSKQTAKQIGEMMRDVVTGGTARGVFDGLTVHVAGKTGTAQTDSEDKQPHSWFVGFAPYEKPKLSFACVIEHGGYGKRGAAPAVRDLLAVMRP